ncbi:MAG: DUF5606 domain-containing protein [Bacteroidota bacterium]
MSIPFKDIVALTGSPGLYKIIKADEKAIIVESLDEKKRRTMVKGNMMVSKLTDVSIYTDEDSEALLEVIKTIKEKYGEELPVKKNDSKDKLTAFLEEVLPAYNKEKVYPSNIKKLISWYNILKGLEVDYTVEEEEEKKEDQAEESKDGEKPKEEEAKKS